MVVDDDPDDNVGDAARRFAPGGYQLDARPVGSTILRLLALVVIAILLILVILPAVLRAAGIEVVAPA
ncbi:MAG: hypothetical protein ABIQ17_07710 [Candidatus Limnocylindrales bacterium]